MSIRSLNKVLAASYEGYIKISADSVKELKKSDVMRVLEECPVKDRKGLAKYIIDNRAEFKLEVTECLQEISS